MNYSDAVHLDKIKRNIRRVKLLRKISRNIALFVWVIKIQKIVYKSIISFTVHAAAQPATIAIAAQPIGLEKSTAPMRDAKSTSDTTSKGKAMSTNKSLPIE